ncbi:ABC transporter ATP-binding protein [Butyricicoccus pullicaecorum]|uniref:ABC transporter n=1 Tax=Butyricicoccus pullicaecorum TaxID=501571 RepID=A0A1Y4LUZ5_9FIRM|nr:ABC transporter ATP-binding protein [Butyricicoccus pullicaecorum]OUP60418.1 ABC transporter [Butyricicoccus pullicaecorum]
MLHIFGYLKRSWKSVVLIFMLLIFQASCDLTLPQFTSNLVDIGIQQNGIAHAAPAEMRDTTMEDLSLFLTDEEQALVSSSYEQSGDRWVRTTDDEKTLEQLDEAMSMPMVMLDTIQSSDQIDRDALYARLASGELTREHLLGAESQMESQLSGMGGSTITQKAILFTQKEYEALGYDLHEMQMNYLLTTGGKMLALSLGMVAAAILVGLIASRTAAELAMHLRESLFTRVVSFGNEEMTKFSTASLITRSTNDIQQVQMVIVMLLRIVLYAPILGLGGIFRVMRTETSMAWIIAVAVGAVMCLVAVLMGVALPRFKKMQTLIDNLNLVAREILTGLPVIRAFSREKHEEERFDRANIALTRTQLFTNRVMTFMMPCMMLIMNVVTVAIVWFGAHGVDLGNMQVGDMMAFITYTMQIIMSFLMISMISIMLPRAGVAADRINEVLTTEPRIRDKAKVEDDKLTDCRGEVVFDDVSFRYPDADADVLEHISFTAKPGQTTAIIGSTGAGKSSLLNLIPRFFDVSYGRITIDGIDIRNLSLHKLHEVLGYVPQKGVLFSGDIESNLKFGGADISDAQMEQAAEIAQATEFIESKPDRYQTPIAQGGTNVSGGQKQRLSIARAIAKNPKIYLFDDSFSALDYKTDAALRRALSERVHDATTIIVAQRISTILHAEQIIVLDEGKVAGIGTHEELMKTCATYQEIARSQLSEKELGGMNA